MRRIVVVFLLAMLVAAVVSFFGCKEETKYITVTGTGTGTDTGTGSDTGTGTSTETGTGITTIHHYYHNVDLCNSSGILGYSFYNIDNSSMGPHYGSITVGGSEGPPMFGWKARMRGPSCETISVTPTCWRGFDAAGHRWPWRRSPSCGRTFRPPSPTWASLRGAATRSGRGSFARRSPGAVCRIRPTRGRS